MKKLKNNENENFNTLISREMESKEDVEKCVENPLERMKNHGEQRKNVLHSLELSIM